ncbi:MAG: alpha/beta hydrolase [Leptolyngbyaceae cyanobacterium RM1_406_9]|nr:alpha/beta hydrolase [Leptolyngbyaceae cyanobacterium RM1_406_9]
MSKKMIQANGVDLCTESFGNPTDPTLLLNAGGCLSMVWWPQDFCRKLAEAGRYVIRYDYRDTGRSITYKPGQIHYSWDDLTDDAVGVLDAYGVDRAHLFGWSMGGMITQLVALKHPERVITITLIMSKPFASVSSDVPTVESEEFLSHFARGQTLDWADEAVVIDYTVESWRLTAAGSKHPFDEISIRALATEDVKRANNNLSSSNHALISGGDRYSNRHREIKIPTLVIHGTADPMVNYQNGVTLAEEIPNATLLTLEGTAHELHRDDWDTIIDAIIQHTQQVRVN